MLSPYSLRIEPRDVAEAVALLDAMHRGNESIKSEVNGMWRAIGLVLPVLHAALDLGRDLPREGAPDGLDAARARLRLDEILREALAGR